MKVSEIKALVPLAEAYELKPEAKYIIVVPPWTTSEAVESLMTSGRELNLNGVVCFGEEIKFYELISEDKQRA